MTDKERRRLTLSHNCIKYVIGMMQSDGRPHILTADTEADRKLLIELGEAKADLLRQIKDEPAPTPVSTKRVINLGDDV